jgi:predicted NBD/HSP70 family sugar kinase
MFCQSYQQQGVVIMDYSRVALVLGGTNIRTGVIERPIHARPPIRLSAQQIKFSSVDELLSFCLTSLHDLSADQNTVVIAVAGPVDTERGIILKLTNHAAMTYENIDLGPQLEQALQQRFNREIKVRLINDGEAAGWAEFGPNGALNDLRPGQVGMALIIGTGIGGRPYFRGYRGELVPIDGGFEPGHTLMSGSMVQFIQGYVGEAICGCGSRPSLAGACLESLASGPAIEQFARSFLTTKLSDTPSILDEELRTITNDPLIQAIAERTGQQLYRFGSATFAQQLINADVTNALRRTDRSMAREILEVEATLLAQRIAAMQRGLDNREQLTFALVGSIGHFWGPQLVSVIGERLQQIGRPTWGHISEVRVGAFPPDETDLRGALALTAHYEQRTI